MDAESVASMQIIDPYAAVIADLEAQRGRIDIAIAAIKALQPLGPPMIVSASPSPAPPKRVIPTDPDKLKALATNLSHQGYGLGEIKTMLELTSAQMQDYFATDV